MSPEYYSKGNWGTVDALSRVCVSHAWPPAQQRSQGTEGGRWGLAPGCAGAGCIPRTRLGGFHRACPRTREARDCMRNRSGCRCAPYSVSVLPALVAPRISMLCARLRRGDWIQIEPACPCKPRASAPVAGSCALGRLGDSWSPPCGSRGILRKRLRRAAAFLEEGAVSRHCLEATARLPAPGRGPSAARLIGRPPRPWPHSHAPHCSPARPGARVSCSPPIGAASSPSGFAFLAGGRLRTRSGPGGPRSHTLESCGIPAQTQFKPRGS